MIAQLLEARRRRCDLHRELAALRAELDRRLGSIASALLEIERLEREADRAMRELEPELHVEGAP